MSRPSLDEELAAHAAAFFCPGGHCPNTYICVVVNKRCSLFTEQQDAIKAAHPDSHPDAPPEKDTTP